MFLMSRRSRRFAILAAFAAAVFCVVVAGHAGVHLGADVHDSSGAGCALCQNTPASAPAPVVLVAGLIAVESAPVSGSPALIETDAPAHCSRGPPVA
jgi:hypothetical protein